MKLIKKILYFIIGILMVSCVGILICALNPTLTGELAEQVQRLQGEPGGQGGEAGLWLCSHHPVKVRCQKSCLKDAAGKGRELKVTTEATT